MELPITDTPNSGLHEAVFRLLQDCSTNETNTGEKQRADFQCAFLRFFAVDAIISVHAHFVYAQNHSAHAHPVSVNGFWKHYCNLIKSKKRTLVFSKRKLELKWLLCKTAEKKEKKANT